MKTTPKQSDLRDIVCNPVYTRHMHSGKTGTALATTEIYERVRDTVDRNLVIGATFITRPGDWFLSPPPS